VTCDELWGGELSEEEAYALALRLSAQEAEERCLLDASDDASDSADGEVRRQNPHCYVRRPHVPVPEYDDDHFEAEPHSVEHSASTETVKQEKLSLHAWAEAQLEQLASSDEQQQQSFEPSALVEFVLGIEDDAELIDYLSAFVGASEAIMCFAIELCERRRSTLRATLQTTH
jgi:hypothetical protein